MMVLLVPVGRPSRVFPLQAGWTKPYMTNHQKSVGFVSTLCEAGPQYQMVGNHASVADNQLQLAESENEETRDLPNHESLPADSAESGDSHCHFGKEVLKFLR